MKSYPSYKDSGVEWLGNVPDHWDVKPLKHIKSSTENAFVDGPFGSNLKSIHFIEGGDVYVIESGFVTSGKFVMGEFKTISAEHFETIKRSSCQPGDIIFAKIGARFGTSGILPELDKKAVVSGNSMKLTVNTGRNLIKYIHYELLHIKKSGTLDLIVNTTAQPALSLSRMNEVKLCSPPLPEQEAIAEFLDCKTTQIDTLIEKKQRQIDLLQEQRAALINHVVTKGLNPDVPMRDSGVEWLGEIPSHWKVKKLKHVTRNINDGTHVTPTYVDKGIPFLRVTDIQSNEIDLETVKRIPESEHIELAKRCNPEKGDLLLSKNGTIGITKVVDWDFPFSIFVSICLIKFDEQINPYFFSYFFQSDVVNKQISDSSKTTSVTNLHLDKIRELIIIVPSKSEQQELISWLDEEMKKIDHLVNLVSRHIELLKEYRMALISEAVTGKIDVRTVHE